MQAQTIKPKKKSSIRRPEVRSLKIHTRFQERADHRNINVPEIRLCGKWLDELGFCQGRSVTVTIMNGMLIVALQGECTAA